MITLKFIESQRQKLLTRLESLITPKENKEHSLYPPKSKALINFALKRIKQEQYGICCDCGCLIEDALLEVYPESPICSLCEREKLDSTN